jgi:hypothetical protein
MAMQTFLIVMLEVCAIEESSSVWTLECEALVYLSAVATLSFRKIWLDGSFEWLCLPA